MSRPVIGVTGPDTGGMAAWIMTSAAIARAGGRPVHITPRQPYSGALDGLVLGGGADVRDGDPAVEPAPPGTQQTTPSTTQPPSAHLRGRAILRLRNLMARPFTGFDEGRDKLERGLLARALERGIPVLGICRGAQLMNVHYGGTLYRDLASYYVETPQLRTVLPRKRIEVESNSRLAHVLGSTSALVNSLHKHAVCAVGAGLSVAARESAGVVQAIEDPSHPFRIGVQWHPEFIPQSPMHQRLFDGLLNAASKS